MPGGVALEEEYNTPKGYGASLCRAIFEDNSGKSLAPKIHSAIGRTDVVVDGWRCQSKGVCARDISYTAPKSEKVDAPYRTYEHQVISNPVDGVCLVDATVSTPTVPYGTRFNTRVRYILYNNSNISTSSTNSNSIDDEGKTKSKKDEKSKPKTKMQVSFDTMWTQGRPVLAPAIKRAVRKQVNKNFRIAGDVLQANTKK